MQGPIDIECGLLSRVSQKIVATKWRIYKGKCFLLNWTPVTWSDRARVLHLIILWQGPITSLAFGPKNLLMRPCSKAQTIQRQGLATLVKSIPADSWYPWYGLPRVRITCCQGILPSRIYRKQPRHQQHVYENYFDFETFYHEKALWAD